MPAITPRAADISLVRRHAVSQGYVEFVTSPSQVATLGSNWVELEEITLEITLDAESDILQLATLSVNMSNVTGTGNHLEMRVRMDSTASDIIQTAGVNKEEGISDGSCSLPWAWTAVSPGSYTFAVDVRLPLGTGSLNAVLGNMMHALVILKR